MNALILSRLMFLGGYGVMLFSLCMWGVRPWKTLGMGSMILIFLYIRQKSDRRMYRMTVLSGIVFVLAGEVYFRMHYFGLDGMVRFSQHVPASLGHPLSSVPCDETASYTGLVPGFEGVVKGGRFRVNQSGFRDGEWRTEKKENAIRVAVLGTSMSMGSGVHQNESYPSVLQRMLDEDPGVDSKVEVMNFGRGGYGPDDFIDMLGSQVMPYQPDIILVEPYDLTKRGLHRLEKFKGTRWELIQWGLREPYQVSFFLRAIHNESGYELMRRIRSAGRIVHGWPRTGGPSRTASPSANMNDEEDLSKARIADYLFRQIRNIVGDRKVFALILPPMSEFPVQERIGPWLRRSCRKYDIELIDGLREDYERGLENTVIYVGDRHANAGTHRVFAAAAFRPIASYIRSRSSQPSHRSSQKKKAALYGLGIRSTSNLPAPSL